MTGVRPRAIPDAGRGWSSRAPPAARAIDAVISTSSPALMARLAPDLPDSYAGSLRALKSMGAVVLVVTLDRQLTQYYWHNLPKDAGFPFLAMVEHTNFIGAGALRRRPHHLLWRLPGTGPRVLQAEQGGAAGALPAGADSASTRTSTAVGSRRRGCGRRAYAQPVPPVNHSHNIPPLRTPRARPLLRQHEPGLPVGSRHQLRGRDRAEGGAAGGGRFQC